MRTSAMNCNRSLKANKFVKSPESCIFLDSSAISFNSCLIALCQSSISSIGYVPWMLETSLIGSKYFLFPDFGESHAQFILSICWINLLAIESKGHWTRESSTQIPVLSASFLLFIQVNTTFNKQSNIIS